MEVRWMAPSYCWRCSAASALEAKVVAVASKLTNQMPGLPYASSSADDTLHRGPGSFDKSHWSHQHRIGPSWRNKLHRPSVETVACELLDRRCETLSCRL
jgi:hypothetical protein